MIKKLAWATALSGLVFLSVGIAQGEPTITYNGRILNSSNCPEFGGNQACWNLTVRLDSGKIIKVHFWGGAIVIYDSKGHVLLRDSDLSNFDSSADERNHFYAAASHLKKGVNVRINDLDCGDDDRVPGCQVTTIHIK